MTRNVKTLISHFKVGLSPSKKNFFISFNNSSSEVMENAFYSNLKLFLFLSWLFVQVETTNDLIRKIRLTSKFMTSQPGQQRITIHIFLNISRIKGNQTMQFGQLIEYNKRNIFLQKSVRNVSHGFCLCH